ncbi:hypothetical protein Gohar_017434 [Gossypium harknessii]|uniref:Uncharacterized protein n=4 Tax=Gossypium TaxID=3633 RepID=A0A7J8WPQ3_GOSAI|nr:hypothetical protein [Gossypium klotzschianum]MBA0676913.1 hypothetical protein [Gossypium aridum]MBA0792995.1 hypothetical protein [Gossypium harknessii]
MLLGFFVFVVIGSCKIPGCLSFHHYMSLDI